MLSPLKYYKKNNKKEILFGYSVLISHLLVLLEHKLIAEVYNLNKVLGFFDLTLQTLHKGLKVTLFLKLLCLLIFKQIKPHHVHRL